MSATDLSFPAARSISPTVPHEMKRKSLPAPVSHSREPNRESAALSRICTGVSNVTSFPRAGTSDPAPVRSRTPPVATQQADCFATRGVVPGRRPEPKVPARSHPSEGRCSAGNSTADADSPRLSPRREGVRARLRARVPIRVRIRPPPVGRVPPRSALE